MLPAPYLAQYQQGYITANAIRHVAGLLEITPAGAWFPETPAGTTEREAHYSGGAAIDPRKTDTDYASRPINGVFEIERWTTSDGGLTWSSTPVTRNSNANNVRPFVVPGNREEASIVMWMRNTGGYVHYTDYRSELRVSIVPDQPIAKSVSGRN